MSKVAVIVVNYRSGRETLRAVRSLRRLNCPDLEIIVVDNASGDGSAAILRDAFAKDDRNVTKTQCFPPPFVGEGKGEGRESNMRAHRAQVTSGDTNIALAPVTVIEAPQNKGYTGGNNLGVAFALERNARYLHLVNPDSAAIDDNYLRVLVEYLERHPRVGQVGPRVHLRERDTIQNTVLRFPWLWRRMAEWLKTRFGIVPKRSDAVTAVEVLNGVCVLIRADCWRDVGGFDERLFAYLEDVDWSFRAAARGWDRVYLPIDSIVHLQKKEGYERGGPVDFLLKRNTLYFLLKHRRVVQAAGYSIAVLLLGAIHLVRQVVGRRPMRPAFNWLVRLFRSYGALWTGRLDRAMDRESAWRKGASEAMNPCDKIDAVSSANERVPDPPHGRHLAGKKLAIVCGIPAPYHSALFVRLAEHPGIVLRVFHCAAGHDDVGWQTEGARTLAYPHEMLQNATPKAWRRNTMVGYASFSVGPRLRAFDPHAVVVFGYNQLTYWLTYLYCQRHGIPFALRSDSNVYCDTSKTFASGLRRRWLRWLIPRADAILTVGSANADYWRRYGASDRQLRLAPFAVDNAAVARLAARGTESSGRMRFLYVGRLVRRKRVDVLLAAFAKLCWERRPVRLTIVGDGPERHRLMQRVAPAARPSIEWVGRAAPADALRRLADADVLVLPAHREPWGLVVNEAMAAGVPVIAAADCGAAIDLIVDGITGWKLPQMNAEKLHRAMSRCVDAPDHVRLMGANAGRRIRSFSLERCVAAIDDWLELVVAAHEPGPQPSVAGVWRGAINAAGQLTGVAAP